MALNPIQMNTMANSVALTLTLAGLASTTAPEPVGRESSYIDGATGLDLGASLDGKITTGSSPTTGKQIQIWGWGSAYDGTTHRYPAGVTGANASLTPKTHWRDVLWPILIINTTGTSDYTYEFSGVPFFPAGMLLLPVRYGVFVHHNTVAALNGTGTNHEIRVTSGKLASSS